MIIRLKSKKHVLIMLFVSILFFISALLISISVKNYYSPQKVNKRLTSEIAAAISGLNTELDQIASKSKVDDTGLREYLERNYQNAFSEKGIEILVYKKDSLKFWTANVFAAAVVTDSSGFRSGIVQSGNGYYLVQRRLHKGFTIVALQLIKYNYDYSNEYLPSGFYKKFSAPHNASVSLLEGVNTIYDPEGKFLFSLTYQQPLEQALWIQYLIFTLYVSSFLFLISVLFSLYLFVMDKFSRKWLLFAGFVADVIILRALQFYFSFPSDLYQMQLYNPAYFASSELLPTLGDFLINALLGLQITFFAYKLFLNSLPKLNVPEYLQKGKAVIFLLMLISVFYFLTQAISGLVLNSGISFRSENILGLPLLSQVGVLIIVTLLLAFLYLFELTEQVFIRWISSPRFLIYLLLAGISLYTLIAYATQESDMVSAVFFLFLLIVLFYKVRSGDRKKFSFSGIFLIVIAISCMATYLVNKSETIREQEKRRLLATHLSDARDNVAEYYYQEAETRMKQDKKLSEMLAIVDSDTALYSVSSYVKEKYFSGYWRKYMIQITVCQKDKTINIKPGNIISGCEEYFDGKIAQFMKAVPVPGLFFLRQSVDAMYYLGKIECTSAKGEGDTRNVIFVEISSNDVWKGLGYPELLYDSKNCRSFNLSGYSYAFYYKGELVKNVGKYAYDVVNQSIVSQKMERGFFTAKGFSHFVYASDGDTMIVLSKEVPRISDIISPFSYIFLLLMIMLILLNGSLSKVLNWNSGIFTFRWRLQLIMISVIVISSIVLITVSMLFINTMNANKNNEILKEKLNSIVIDLETRYGQGASFDRVARDELSDLLLNLSNTYFTDINLYNSGGYMLASSRDQIFREGMISQQISPAAAQQLMGNNKSFFIQQENIGSYAFLSAYAPVRNLDNRLLGYLNLPYFAKQEEIRREISGLVSAFANIYIIMIVITVILALLLSRYITKPLQLIGNQFGSIKMGDKNAKIEWVRKDEIGRLVDEYNRMIDEMEKSAELLARSERESAWRMMARQVAHEIKNPLTPIKLSMQLLMKAWDDKAPDWELRLKRFSQTLIMQIDTLSAIASEFSDFAQMPEPQIGQFDVIPLVQQSAALFRNQSDCEITFDTEFSECIIKADPNQILRVFNNLIKNALQAIPGDRQGMLQIRLTVSAKECEISFKDNGTGISDEKLTRIFSPNFTTKTAGMGLGLAMVKNIIDHSSGRIWFETVPGEGSTFFVALPMKD
jgi:two-component system nitrogen regulation sensor histidine kinase NtrY